MPICIIIYIYNVIYIYIYFPFICKNVPHCNLPLILLTKKKAAWHAKHFFVKYFLCFVYTKSIANGTETIQE